MIPARYNTRMATEGEKRLYFKAPHKVDRSRSLAADWGECVRYLEVGENQFAVRQIDVFKNGNALRYDRSHWCDAYGMLCGLRFSRQPKWRVFFPGLQIITAEEFERAWREATDSPVRRLQIETSRAAEWGDTPHWLKDVGDGE